eukprot:8283643-Lingulodinium_polyedra.AAC.1
MLNLRFPRAAFARVCSALSSPALAPKVSDARDGGPFSGAGQRWACGPRGREGRLGARCGAGGVWGRGRWPWQGPAAGVPAAP